MPQATFRHGNPLMVDYTAGADQVNGDIVLLGNTAGVACGVMHQDLANAAFGAIAVRGGVYDVKVADNYAAWTYVYWDAANAIATTTSTNMSPFGYTVEASAAANAVVKTLHVPNV